VFRVSPPPGDGCAGLPAKFQSRPESRAIGDHPPQSRTTQPITMIVAMPAMIRATRGPLGTHSSHRPDADDASSHGPTRAHNTASRAPPAFARKASRQQPRTTQAKAVVEPQLGHGRPNSISNEHGGKPSCWCVPYPRSLGCKNKAMTSGHKKPTPSTAAIHRCRPKRCRFKGASGCVTLDQPSEVRRIPRSGSASKSDSTANAPEGAGRPLFPGS